MTGLQRWQQAYQRSGPQKPKQNESIRSNEMNTTRLRQVRKAFPQLPGVPACTTRHNRRAWVRSVRGLGNKWKWIDMVEKQEAA